MLASILTFLSGILLGGAIKPCAFGLAAYGGWHGNFDWDTVWVDRFLMQNQLLFRSLLIY